MSFQLLCYGMEHFKLAYEFYVDILDEMLYRAFVLPYERRGFVPPEDIAPTYVGVLPNDVALLLRWRLRFDRWERLLQLCSNYFR